MDILKLAFKAMLLFGLITIVYSGTVQQIYIKDSKVPLKGGNIQIVCEVSQFANEAVYITRTYLSVSEGTITCTSSKCYGFILRHTFSPSISGVTVTITNLNRSEDQKYWTCAINNQRKHMQLIVYTITPSLQYNNPPSQDQDLVQNSVTLKCSTECAYPSPKFTWYYSKTSGSRQEWSTTLPVTNRTGGCTDSEKIYTSTLTLSRYTQFTDNTDTSVKFQCAAISITGTEDQIFTPASVNVKFAGKPKVCDCNNGAVNNDIKAVIVGIVLGIIIVVVVAYAGYVTILLKRKGENTAENTFVQPAIRTVPLNTNVVFSTNDSEEQQGTDPDESRESQYTSLKTELKDDRQTYEQLKV